MNKQVKQWERYSVESLARNEQLAGGRLFMSEFGLADLSRIRLLHAGLDTVKQLYSGKLRQSVLEEVERVYNDGFGECMELGGHLWLIGSGGASGYQYRLQNSDLGLILFVKSRYSERDQDYSHLKIECSPHWLQDRKAVDMQRELDALAAEVLIESQTNGCAAHLCVDVQGWEPPKDLADRLVSHARRLRSHNAGTVIYLDMGEVACKFDNGQSYLWGSASSVQLALYRKDVQARAVDKLDFWRGLWRRAVGDYFDEPAYDEKKPVWRIELRFHHSVMAEFGAWEYDDRAVPVEVRPGEVREVIYGTDPRKAMSRISGVVTRLQGLWKYGLNAFRLEVQEKGCGRYIDSAWQLFRDDANFLEPSFDRPMGRKRKTPGDGNERNVALAFGNMLSIFARNRLNPHKAWECLKASGIYDDVFYMMQRRAWDDYRLFNEQEIYEAVVRGLRRRTLLGRGPIHTHVCGCGHFLFQRL